jgi:hypothetical protein
MNDHKKLVKRKNHNQMKKQMQDYMYIKESAKINLKIQLEVETYGTSLLHTHTRLNDNKKNIYPLMRPGNCRDI